MPKSRVINDNPAEQKHSIRRDSGVVTLAFQIAEEFGLPMGSVWLMNPDGSKADSHMHIGNWLNQYNCWDLDLLDGVQSMIPEIVGKPFVNLDSQDKSVYVSRRIYDVEVTETAIEGMCEWVDPEDVRPGELTDGLMISCDCLKIGPNWWLDTYFNWYCVFDPELALQSLRGDHSWVDAFLKKTRLTND